MLHDLLERIERLVLTRPASVLSVALMLTAVALVLGAGIELRTSRSELVAEDDEEQIRWEALIEEFAGPDPVIVALESTPGAVLDIETLQRSAAALAAALEALPEVDHVFYHLELDWILDHAIHLAPPIQLTRAAEQLEGLLGDASGEIVLTGFAAFNDRLAAKIEDALHTGAVLPSRGASDEAGRLIDVLRAQREFLSDPDAFVSRHSGSLLEIAGSLGDASITADGYLSTRDRRMVFLLVSPRDAGSNLVKQRQITGAIRETARRVLENEPIRHGLTGTAAMTVEEMDQISRDTRRTSAISIAGVAILALLAFRRRRHALLGLAVLAIGVAWSIGAVRLELGYLNMITTALVPILVGIGIDFAVHPISQYEIEREQTTDRRTAVRAAFRKTSSAVVVSAFTTAAAFFCFGFMEFRGFSELGVVAGGGVLLCLLAALFVLPSLLMLRGAVAPTQFATVDKLWIPVADVLVRHPRVIVTAAIAVTLVSAWGARSVQVNTSLLELLPPGAESLRYLRVVSEESAISAYVNIVATDDLDELRQFQRRARDYESIARFESVLQFLPESGAETDAAVRQIVELLDRVRIEDVPWSGRHTLVESFERLEIALEDAAEAAFITGLADLIGPLERARAEAETARQRVLDADEAADAAWAEGERQMRQRLADLLERIRLSAATSAPSLASLPDHLRTRYLTSRGRFLGFIHPAQSMFEQDFLEQFNHESRQVSPDAIGFPTLFEAHSRQITSGFTLTLTFGILLVVMILMFDLRHLGHTLLALVPVLVGITWMLGLMRTFGLSFNLANLVAAPLVLGVGIDNGVHMVHRFRLEGHDGIVTVLRHTGRAILVASLTTMVGFGSLGFASHRGMASLGVLLFIGVGTSMLAALIVLPNLLVAMGLVARR